MLRHRGRLRLLASPLSWDRRVFVRVVQREAWELELVERQEKLSFDTREAALERARSHAPEWIELGEVAEASGGLPRRHVWTTFRRRPDGGYERSPLAWGGRPGAPSSS